MKRVIEDLIVFNIDVIFFNILDSIFYISLYKIIRTWKYHKAIFWSGKEDLSDTHYSEVITAKTKYLPTKERP